MKRVLIGAIVAASLLLSACGGSGEVEVPKVTGWPEDEALEILLDADLDGDFTYAQGEPGPVRATPNEALYGGGPDKTCDTQVAIEQVPPPGESLEEGSRVRVLFDCP